jgi:PEP-CTERM motif
MEDMSFKVLLAGCALAASFAIAAPASATITLVTSSAGFNDSISWSQLGPVGTQVNPSFNLLTSSGGLVGLVTSLGTTDFSRVDQDNGTDTSNGWKGNFTANTPLLYNDDVASSVNVSFISSAVQGAGAQIQADLFGGFTAQITVTDSSGVQTTFSEEGVSNNVEGGAIFIGALSDTADITEIDFALTSAIGGDLNNFAVGPVALVNPAIMPTSPTPEPGTWAMMLIGFGGLGATLRTSRRRQAATA